MNKLRLRVRELDGVTLVDKAPDFQQVDGWLEASIASPVGIFPAALWGRVPGGDPYLLHVSVLTTGPLEETDHFELQSGPPVRPRAQYRPSADNTRIVLIKPTDRLRFQIDPQQEIVVEMLIESIGGVNELGSRLFAWAHATATSNAGGARTALLAGPGPIPAWIGILHVVHDSPVGDAVTLPPRGLVPLDATLTITRRGTGVPMLTAIGNDKLSGGVTNIPVTRTLIVMNNGYEWAFVGT